MTTNRDRLNQMTNEELAEVFTTRICQVCYYKNLDCGRIPCYDGILSWLNQECEE